MRDSNVFEIKRLADGLDAALKATDAYEYLIDRIAAVFLKCSLVRTVGLFDEMAVLEAINEIDLCIKASGEDSRVAGLCRYALELSGVGENELMIDGDGKVKRRMVYFIRNSRGSIKIGSSMNVEDRLHHLETGAGERLELIASVPGSFGAERELHARFTGLREHGEWFSPGEELLEYINQLQLTFGLDAA
ncbi:GIY-YIG nuclease family protein [Pseudomonas aeruginosa]|uniref:GIY-YIG nuclease family protein n=1 Tax=Pseudomonas aeruginosa TaxID=287 RepID=UPI00068F8066|nr:GIY-YIG nuclease family protein [Pseudomonas aeruginosa]